MKCRSHVSPLWKNPAANGPWYQVRVEPGHPRREPRLDSGGEVDDRDRRDQPGRSASATGRSVRAGACGVGRRGRRSASPAGASPRPAESAKPDADSDDAEQIRHRLEQPEASRAAPPTQIRSASASTARRQVRRRALEARQQPRARRAPPPSQANPTSSGELGDAQQVAPEAEHLAAARSRRMICSSSAIRSSLATREVDDAAERRGRRRARRSGRRGRGRAPRRARPRRRS